MKMTSKIMIVLSIGFAVWSSFIGKSNFGLEEINAVLNKKIIGHWILDQKIIDTLKVSFQSDSDTLKLSGYCDCGCLDGSKILIKNGKLELVTEIKRKSMLDKIDSLNNLGSNEKISVSLAQGIEFIITKKDLVKLETGKLYSLYLKYWGKESREEKIFFFLLA